MKMNFMKNKSSWLKSYSVFFVVFVFVMMFAQLFTPNMTLSSISENYLSRKGLIKLFNNLKYRIGDRVFQLSLVGKDGWLYYTGEFSMQDYQKNSPLNMSGLKRLTKILEQIKDQTEEYGGVFLLVIPPNKSTVYPQYMPDEITVIGQSSNLDRLVEYLNTNSDIQLLDLRPIFSVLSENTELYYKTDTHWNCLGAFYASNEILSMVSNSYPQIQPYSPGDFDFFPSKLLTMDISSMMGLDLQEDYIDPIPKFDIHISKLPLENINYKIPSLQITVNDIKDLPNLLIFKDSFYGCMGIYIEPNFSRTVSMNFVEAELIDYLDIIAAEKPDVVIVEFVERSIEIFYRHLSK